MQARTLFGRMSAAALMILLSTNYASATCPGDCPVAGGGTTSTDCLVEYFGLATSTSADSRRVVCEDGAQCDQDGAVNGSCTFDVRVCLNQDDPSLTQCTAKGVNTFTLRGATNDAELTSLQSKVQALLPTSTAACTDAQSITVPVGGTAEKPTGGRKRIASDAVGDAGKDFDHVELTCNPPPRPLGVRHFSVNPANSPLVAIIGPLSLPIAGFQGFLDLQAGTPDENGIAPITAVGSSPFLRADATGMAGMIICLKPHITADPVGVVACKGLDVSYMANVNHVAGVVGQNGFTADQCTALTGTLGHGTVEGPTAPHPGDCNGPINIGPGHKGDSGRGAVAITPDPTTGVGGLEFELSFVHPGQCRNDESIDCTSNEECGDGGLCEQDCGDGPPGQMTALPFFSGPLEVQIFNADGRLNNNRDFKITGQNFSCANWSVENGPGKIIFAIPQLHAFSLSPGSPPSDLITAFVLSDR